MSHFSRPLSRTGLARTSAQATNQLSARAARSAARSSAKRFSNAPSAPARTPTLTLTPSPSSHPVSVSQSSTPQAVFAFTPILSTEQCESDDDLADWLDEDDRDSNRAEEIGGYEEE